MARHFVEVRFIPYEGVEISCRGCSKWFGEDIDKIDDDQLEDLIKFLQEHNGLPND